MYSNWSSHALNFTEASAAANLTLVIPYSYQTWPSLWHSWEQQWLHYSLAWITEWHEKLWVACVTLFIPPEPLFTIGLQKLKLDLDQRHFHTVWSENDHFHKAWLLVPMGLHFYIYSVLLRNNWRGFKFFIISFDLVWVW